MAGEEVTQKISEHNRIKAICDVLQLKLNPVLKKKLGECADKMILNGAHEADSSCILNACAKRMLEQTAELEVSNTLQLDNDDLENLVHCRTKGSEQLNSDIKRHESMGMVITGGSSDSNTQIVNSSVFFQEDEFNLHKRILDLKKEINMKKEVINNLRAEISEYEGLPPDIELAKKMVAEAKQKLEETKVEIQQLLDHNSSLAAPSS